MGTTFRHSDLVAKIASDYPDLPSLVLRQAVDTMTEAITERLTTGGRVELRGFGSFWIAVRDSRVGRNPATASTVNIPSRPYVRFRSGKILSEMLNC